MFTSISGQVTILTVPRMVPRETRTWRGTRRRHKLRLFGFTVAPMLQYYHRRASSVAIDIDHKAIAVQKPRLCS